jgi:putative ATP-dependent endonuclease of OLD family
VRRRFRGLVIPLIAKAKGLPIDRSFVAIVPLGGRHTNYFWRLVRSLQIPHATLLDLDWGRNGGGIGRIKTVCQQLQDFGMDPFAGIDGYETLDDLHEEISTEEIKKWMEYLRTWGVFFSTPLDLDMSLLDKYFDYYTKNLDEGATGPDFESDPAPAVLGSKRPSIEYWTTPERKPFLSWYRYLFSNRSKPATHLRALATVPIDKLAAPPRALAQIIDAIKDALTLP